MNILLTCKLINCFVLKTMCFLVKLVKDSSRTSNISSLFDEFSSNVGFRFWFNPSEYFHQKGFIPLSRVLSFWQDVIKFLYF